MKTFLIYCKQTIKGIAEAGEYCTGVLSDDNHTLSITNKEGNSLIIQGIDDTKPFHTSPDYDDFYILRQLKPIDTIETEEWLPNPEIPGYLSLSRKRTLGEVYKDIVQALKEQDIYDLLDYFQVSGVSRDDKEPFPDYRWISVFPVKGGSEGYYFHIEAIHEGKRNLIFLGKTLYEDKETALKINNALVSLFL